MGFSVVIGLDTLMLNFGLKGLKFRILDFKTEKYFVLYTHTYTYHDNYILYTLYILHSCSRKTLI